MSVLPANIPGLNLLKRAPQRLILLNETIFHNFIHIFHFLKLHTFLVQLRLPSLKRPFTVPQASLSIELWNFLLAFYFYFSLESPARHNISEPLITHRVFTKNAQIEAA